jgi:hypothetical protein
MKAHKSGIVLKARPSTAGLVKQKTCSEISRLYSQKFVNYSRPATASANRTTRLGVPDDKLEQSKKL